MAKKFLTPISVLNLSADPQSANEGDIYYNTSSDVLRIYSNSQWTDVSSGGGGAAGYPQNEEPTSPAPTTGVIWLDTDDEADSYPAYPTVIYSPSDPSASLTFADVGTIWVDETVANMVETVVPAVLYQDTAPSGLTTAEAGYLWVDEDADVVEYNMNEYARKDEIINPFMLAGM